MKRNAMQSLINWKNDPERKPLILRGARQVGKTWLMKEFGQTCYANYVYFNFDEEDELKSIFQANKNPHRIIELLSMISGEKIQPGETLILFDEIQECPEALNTLKYFKEKSERIPCGFRRKSVGNHFSPAKILSGRHGKSTRYFPTDF